MRREAQREPVRVRHQREAARRTRGDVDGEGGEDGEEAALDGREEGQSEVLEPRVDACDLGRAACEVVAWSLDDRQPQGAQSREAADAFREFGLQAWGQSGVFTVIDVTHTIENACFCVQRSSRFCSFGHALVKERNMFWLS